MSGRTEPERAAPNSLVSRLLCRLRDEAFDDVTDLRSQNLTPSIDPI
jgi:hypothetical protein